MVNMNSKGYQPRRKKVNLIFDEAKRREFLSGFHKRKVQRRQKAQEALKCQLKEEKKRIKQDVRERYKKLVSNRDIPELEKLLFERKIEIEGHTVSILEFDLADPLGIDKCKEGGENNTDDNVVMDDNNDGNDNIIGMSMTENTDRTVEQNVSNSITEVKDNLKRAVKKASIREIKKSKAFQQKQKLDRVKNKKEHRRKIRKQNACPRKEKAKKKINRRIKK